MNKKDNLMKMQSFTRNCTRKLWKDVMMKQESIMNL